MRTGKTIDEIYDKPEKVRNFLFASIEFELGREEEARKARERAMRQKGRR